MTWQTGTSTDYLDLLTQLKQIGTSNHVATAVVSAGGTGYVVGDILTASGGTSTHAATFEVLAVSGGVVTSLRIATGGAYTVNPSSPVSTTGGSGSGCTVTVTFADTGWTLRRESQEAVSATVSAGGTGYAVNDQLTVSGGVGVGTAAVFNVDTVSSGAVTAVSLVTAGNYEEIPTNPVATTGGGGSGCTLTVTWQGATTDKVMILEGEGGGSDEILVGVKTFQDTDPSTFNTVYNWSLHGMAGGYNANLEFHEQPGISPGLDGSTGAILTTGGAYVPLKDSDAFDMSFWFSITTRRIIGVAKVETASITHYMPFYMGFLNQAGTSTEFPYPIFICGASARNNTWYATTDPSLTGLVEMIGITARTGPGFYRQGTGTWQEYKNSTATDTGANTRNASDDYCCYPGNAVQITVATEDIVVSSTVGLMWDDILPTSGVPGSPTFQVADTPQTGDDVKILIPATLTAGPSPNTQIQGEMDNVFWFSARGGVSSEDTFLISNERYRVFQGGNRIEVFSFVAIKEE